jgi:hypothetical protein
MVKRSMFKGSMFKGSLVDDWGVSDGRVGAHMLVLVVA